MRKRLLLVLLTINLCGISGIQHAYASHAAGGELLYEWIQDSTYRIVFKFYRDCSGPADRPVSQTVCYYSECGGPSGSVVLQLIPDPANGSEVNPGCPGYPTRCASGILPGYAEWIYTAEVTLPARCHTWHFYTAITSRNNAIINLVTPSSQNLWFEATLNNEAAQGNSSPSFSVKPIPYICMGIPYIYNNGAVDINNDSLYFENTQPLTGPAACSKTPNALPIPYHTSYLLNEPFATGNTYSFNTTTGQISFTPALQQVAVISTKVREYRNGVEIGSVMRDIQIVVIPCNVPQPIMEIDTPSLYNATLAGERIEGCSGAELRLCINLKSPDTGAILVATDNSTSSIPGAVLTYTGQATDSIKACIAWTPGYLDTGLSILTFTVKDSTCRPPAGILDTRTFAVPMYIRPATGIIRDTAICPGDMVQLRATGGSNFQWGVLPGGSSVSSLSCTNCQNPTASPDRTTQYTVVANNNSVCNKNSDTVTVLVLTPSIIDIGPDMITCVNNDLQLDINLLQIPGINYQIAWTPATYLNDTAIPAPVARPNGDITYYVVVKPSGLEHCNARDSISIRVLKGFELHNGDTMICSGSTVITHVTGDSRYSYTWTPAQGVSGINTMSPQIAPDTTRTYLVTATYPGCQDSVASLSITVHHATGATVTVYGDTLEASSGDSYQWIDCDTYMPVAGADRQQYIPHQSGRYSAIITTNGCSDTSVCIDVTAKNNWIRGTNLNDNIFIYPNPAEDRIIIQTTAPLQHAAIRLINMTGQILTEKTAQKGMLFEISLPPATGIYLLEISDSGKTTRMKLTRK